MRVPWPLGVGGQLLFFVVIGLVTGDGELNALGWLVGLLGLTLLAVGLLRRDRV
jgi:hypothetical protein